MADSIESSEKSEEEAILKAITKGKQTSAYSQGPLLKASPQDGKSRQLIKTRQIFSKEREKTHDGLFILRHPYSIIAEQFKIIRNSLLRLEKDKNIKTLLVTSALPAEGKTFVASNLAISIAKVFDGFVLLVDTDLRKPAINKIFQIKLEGLSNFLLNEKKLEDLVIKTDVQNLLVLASGPRSEKHSELLSSKKMKDLIEEAKASFGNCLIIFDSVPVLLAEPITLADLVDGIILVVRAEKTGKKLVKKAVETLGKEKILGVILNHCRKNIVSYHSYYHYYKTSKEDKEKISI